MIRPCWHHLSPNRRLTLLFIAHPYPAPPPSSLPPTAVIWSKTSRGRGGARDPAAAPAARAAHVLEELAQLDEGGEAAALMSAEGFKAYADDSIWVSKQSTPGVEGVETTWQGGAGWGRVEPQLASRKGQAVAAPLAVGS